jgi:hypothetical protein
MKPKRVNTTQGCSQGKIEPERERERETHTHTHTCFFIFAIEGCIPLINFVLPIEIEVSKVQLLQRQC